MSFPYKHVLLLGATSGIGKGMADRLIAAGIKVTAVGRRRENLDAFVAQYGESSASAVAFDLTKVELMPKFAADIMRQFPDIDCIFLNAGVQGRYDFSQPSKVDLDSFIAEINLNFTSFVAITHALLPYLMKKESEASLIYTGTHLATVPASSLSAYSASKAALNAFVLCLRDQLRNTKIKVVDISPPVVQTELHDYLGKEVGRKIGMPLDVFSEHAFQGLVSGSDQIIIGNIGPGDGIVPKEEFEALVNQRRSIFTALAKLMRGEK